MHRVFLLSPFRGRQLYLTTLVNLLGHVVAATALKTLSETVWLTRQGVQDFHSNSQIKLVNNNKINLPMLWEQLQILHTHTSFYVNNRNSSEEVLSIFILECSVLLSFRGHFIYFGISITIQKSHWVKQGKHPVQKPRFCLSPDTPSMPTTESSSLWLVTVCCWNNVHDCSRFAINAANSVSISFTFLSKLFPRRMCSHYCQVISIMCIIT